MAWASFVFTFFFFLGLNRALETLNITRPFSGFTEWIQSLPAIPSLAVLSSDLHNSFSLSSKTSPSTKIEKLGFQISIPYLAARMANPCQDFSQLNISEEEKDKLVAEVIRYVLFKTHQNCGCPIKREELIQIVTKNYRQRSLPAFVINEAIGKLSSIFGLEMRELQRARPSSANQQSAADAKSYVLISQLPADVYQKYVEDVDTAHLTGFTFVVISIVLLAGGKIPEENLWQHLKRMGLHETDESHSVLGNIKQALETLVQQRYLQKDKVNGPEGNTLVYELAERALDGPVNERIKEYISQIVKKDVGIVEID